MLKGNVREIITDIDLLDSPCDIIDPVKESVKAQQIVLDLKTTMRDKKLPYLTAPQIGEKYRIFCIKTGEDTYTTYVNPIIEFASEGRCIAREACSSIHGKEYLRWRYNGVRVIYQSPLGIPDCIKAEGPSAWMLQHCIDHLDGLLLPFVGLEVDEMFDNATKEEQEQVIEMYLESLDMRCKQVKEEIEQDPKLKEMYDAIKFMDGVRDGSVTLEKIKEDKE